MASNSLTDVPEQSHEAMRAAAMRPTKASTTTPVTAAGGGLELPGREQSDAALPFVGIDPTREHEPIPGERDPATLTQREPGAMTAPFNGVDLDVPDGLESTMDAMTVRERVREGGGLIAERLWEKRGGR